jgi:hypothetical protein
VKAKIGPVALEAEIWYLAGDLKHDVSSNNPSGPLYDQKVSNNLEAYIDATVNLGMFYFGGMFAYASGDDPTTTDKIEGGLFGTGKNLNATLLLFNRDRYYWNGALNGNNAAAGVAATYQMTNGLLYQLRGGVKPTDKLDIMASVTYATVDRKIGTAFYSGIGATGVTTGVGDTYGTELDVTASYKITNNLTYMLGAGYLWTGNFFQGTNSSNTVVNDYIVLNKLTLTF